MRYFTTLFVLFIGTQFSCFSQTTIGLRLGGYNGVTYRTENSPVLSHLEIMGALPFDGGIYLTGLVEQQFELSEKLDWYYGGGAHAAAVSGGFALGIDAVLGLYYAMEKYPLVFTLDWKPAVDIFGNMRFRERDGALSIRYKF